MDVQGVGTIPYECPPEELKPFFRKKIGAWSRTWGMNKDGEITLERLYKVAESFFKEYPEEDEKMKKKIADRVAVMKFIACYTDDSVQSLKEEDVVEIWIEKIFTTGLRKAAMEETKKFAVVYFEQLDSNGDGVIDYQEFISKLGVTVKKGSPEQMFKMIDMDKNGVLSLEEITYSLVYAIFSSQPGEPLSNMWGEIKME